MAQETFGENDLPREAIDHNHVNLLLAFYSCTKHIDILMKFTKKKIESGDIFVELIGTDQQINRY